MVNIGASGKQNPTEAAKGGTGLTSITDGGIMLGSGTGPVTVTAQPTNGQLLIGSSGGDPVLAALTEGANVTITNGAGTITIAAGGSGPGNGDLTQLVLYSDCLTLTNSLDGPFISTGSVEDGDADHPGILKMDAGEYISTSTKAFFTSGGTINITVWARTDGSTASGYIALGIQNTQTTIPTDAIIFRHSSAEATTNWYAITRASSSETTTNTGITLGTTTFHKFEININAAGTSVVFKIDGTTYATHATNIPTVGNHAFCWGGANPDLYVDAYLLVKTFTGDRAT